MRPKIVFGLLVLAVLFLGIAVLLKQHTGSATVPAPAAPEPVAPPVASTPPPPAPSPTPIASPPPHVLTAEERQAAIDAEMGRLQDWSMNSDPASLSNILADLTNSEKDIREAAIEATKQFGSTNAIPALKAAAINSTDTDEQIEMLQAANFLTLPPLRVMPSQSAQNQPASSPGP
jgi:type IV secretory pathway VirB10-like protein